MYDFLYGFGGKIGYSYGFVGAEGDDFVVQEEWGFNGFGVGGVDSGLELKGVLLMVDFPDFDDALRLTGDGVFYTASTSQEVALKSENLGVTVKAWMLFFGHEYVFVEDVVVIEITCSVEEQYWLICKCVGGECSINFINS